MEHPLVSPALILAEARLAEIRAIEAALALLDRVVATLPENIDTRRLSARIAEARVEAGTLHAIISA